MMLATETVSLGELLDARMFLEVPLAGLAAANADRGDRGRAAGGDRRGRRPRTGHAAVQRRRQALPPDPRPRRRQRAAAGVHRLDPRGAAAAADREDRPARGRRGDPAPAPRHPARGAPPAAGGGGEGDARAHRLPDGDSARPSARELVGVELPLAAPARRRPGRAATGTPSAAPTSPYSPSSSIDATHGSPAPARSPRPCGPRRRRWSRSRSGSRRARRGGGTSRARSRRRRRWRRVERHRLAVHPHPAEDRHRAVAVLAEHPRLDRSRPGRRASAAIEVRSRRLSLNV